MIASVFVLQNVSWGFAVYNHTVEKSKEVFMMFKVPVYLVLKISSPTQRLASLSTIQSEIWD
jgi:hypothetical protein